MHHSCRDQACCLQECSIMCQALQKDGMSSNMQLTKRSKPKQRTPHRHPILLVRKEQHGHHLRKLHRHPYNRGLCHFKHIVFYCWNWVVPCLLLQYVKLISIHLHVVSKDAYFVNAQPTANVGCYRHSVYQNGHKQVH
jgi:hypothetical protein